MDYVLMVHNNSVKWAWQLSAYFMNEKKVVQRLSDLPQGYMARAWPWTEFCLCLHVLQTRVTNNDNSMPKYSSECHLISDKKEITP